MLKRNIRSVQKQTFENFEHIIIDDGCDPRINSIVESFDDDRLVLIKHDQPKGAAASYNSGIRVSRGLYITFLDDDDEYLPEFLLTMLERFKNVSIGTGFIWTGIQTVIDTGSIERVDKIRLWPSKFLTKESAMVAATTIGNGFGLCIKSACLNKVGIFNEDYIVCSDTDFMIRLASGYDCETIDSVLVKIHIHCKGQLTSSQRNCERIRNWELILGNYTDIFNKYPEMFLAHSISFAKLCYKSSKRVKGRLALFSCIKKSPFHARTYIELLSLELTKTIITETYFGKFLKVIFG